MIRWLPVIYIIISRRVTNIFKMSSPYFPPCLYFPRYLLHILNIWQEVKACYYETRIPVGSTEMRNLCQFYRWIRNHDHCSTALNRTERIDLYFIYLFISYYVSCSNCTGEKLQRCSNDRLQVLNFLLRKRGILEFQFGYRETGRFDRGKSRREISKRSG